MLSYSVNCIIITPRPFHETGILCLRRDRIGTNMILVRDRIVSSLGHVEDSPEFKQVPDPANGTRQPGNTAYLVVRALSNDFTYPCSSSRFREQKEQSLGGLTMLITICRQAILNLLRAWRSRFISRIRSGRGLVSGSAQAPLRKIKSSASCPSFARKNRFATGKSLSLLRTI